MFGMLDGERVRAASSGALETASAVKDGVRAQPDIGVIATRKDWQIDVLVWNYHDDDIAADQASIDLKIEGVPVSAGFGVVKHFRIDSIHSNAFTSWKQMGSPESLTSEQKEKLERDGQLQLLSSPESVVIDKGSLDLKFKLPRQAVSLLRITWKDNSQN